MKRCFQSLLLVLVYCGTTRVVAKQEQPQQCRITTDIGGTFVVPDNCFPLYAHKLWDPKESVASVCLTYTPSTAQLQLTVQAKGYFAFKTVHAWAGLNTKQLPVFEELPNYGDYPVIIRGKNKGSSVPGPAIQPQYQMQVPLRKEHADDQQCVTDEFNVHLSVHTVVGLLQHAGRHNPNPDHNPFINGTMYEAQLKGTHAPPFVRMVTVHCTCDDNGELDEIELNRRLRPTMRKLFGW